MLEPQNILDAVNEAVDYLAETHDKYNQELAVCLMAILKNEPLKNYVNFNNAFITIVGLGNWKLARKCMDIAEYEISLVSGCVWDKNHYAFMNAAVELAKANACKNIEKPSIKDKYLYVLEFSNKTVKIGITKEKEKRMKAISSASGMDITRSFFTGKIENVQELETEVHRHFKENRLNGEFFDVDFESAVAEVKSRILKKNKAS